MIRINNIRLPLDYNDSTLKSSAANELRISENDIDKLELFRLSIDARKKNDIHYTATLYVELNCDEKNALSKSKSKNCTIQKPYEYSLPTHKPLGYRPIIVGFGPAGMLAGMILASEGEKPIIIERGADCDTRVKDVESFIKTGNLNINSNIQFGEGGAGTFSDGKLNTGTKDPRARKVLIEFNRHGAPDEILYNAKPHIGTDKLRETVKNIRNNIIKLGGEVRFNTSLKSLIIKDGELTGAVIDNGTSAETVETKSLILAIGHSSRDTMRMLYDSGVFLEQKPFSVGARIEHLRVNIDKAQYGSMHAHEKLKSAPYKLNVTTSNGRGAYTFCMCPGGEVVAASSEADMLCTNGMSKFARDMTNSNSALLVSVNPDDYGSTHPLAGIEFQRDIERKAFVLGGGGYKAPVQRVGDFLSGTKTTYLGEVTPSYRRGFEFAEIDNCLPSYVVASMREAIVKMDNHLKGFASNDAILTAAEARSSSPVRITRDRETLQSVNVKGLYPCGEGAGYAGGIVSAAVDGIKCAEKVLGI